MHDPEAPDLAISISFGGTKIALAIVPCDGSRIIAVSPRIEWRSHRLWNPDIPFESLLNLAVDCVDDLLRQNDLAIESIMRIGIAWPGPGHYDEGLLQATFIPGLDSERNVHSLLLDCVRRRFGAKSDSITILSQLDVNARARGELRLANGAFKAGGQASTASGIVLNIATGIAGAIVLRGRALATWRNLGRTYGQWGRFVLRNARTGEWIWRATPDGSIPPHSHEEVRLTELCGGPALARRYMRMNGTSLTGERDVGLERECLIAVTQDAYAGNKVALRFLREAGSEVGCAVRCILDAFAAPELESKLVLVGSVGELFGLPPKQGADRDEFLMALSESAKSQRLDIVRSTAGLDAELAGAV